MSISVFIMFYISSLMFNGNFVCALRVSFSLVFYNKTLTPLVRSQSRRRSASPTQLSLHALTHVFEATDIGGGEIVSGPALPQPDGVFPSSNGG